MGVIRCWRNDIVGSTALDADRNTPCKCVAHFLRGEKGIGKGVKGALGMEPKRKSPLAWRGKC